MLLYCNFYYLLINFIGCHLSSFPLIVVKALAVFFVLVVRRTACGNVPTLCGAHDCRVAKAFKHVLVAVVVEDLVLQ